MVGSEPIISNKFDLNYAFEDLHSNNYTSNNNLVLWARMSGSLHNMAPTDLGPNDMPLEYEGIPNFTIATFGDNDYPAAEFVDLPGGTSANVVSSDGLLSFSSAGDGGTPTLYTDRPFSVSLWVNLDNLTNYNYLFAKQGTAVVPSSTDLEYMARVDQNGKIQFRLEDETAGASNKQTATSPPNIIDTNQWYHIVCTYDGYGGATASLGLKIYADGVRVDQLYTGANDYKGMEPDYGRPLYIGGKQNNAEELDGRMAEVAIWNTELSAEEVSSVYNATQSVTKKYTIRKGGFHSIESNILFNDSMVTPVMRSLKSENTGVPSGAPLVFCQDCADGETISFSGQLGPAHGYSNDYLGIVPYTITITVPGGASAWTGNNITDDGQGRLLNTGATSAEGTINYETAEWTLKFDEVDIPSAGSDFKIDLSVRSLMSSIPITDAGDKVIMVPNHESERRDFGQPKVFKDEEPFEDFQKFNPVLYLTDDNNTLMYPLVLANASMRDPDQFDGVIEPFTIKSRASRLSTELPFFAHDIRASISSDASQCSRLKAVPIVQFVDNEQSAFDYYEDGIENFGQRLMQLESEEKPHVIGPVYPGYLTQAESTINPFVESSDTEDLRADLHIIDTTYGGTAAELIDPGGMQIALKMMSKYEYSRADGTTGLMTPHSNEDHLPRHHTSSGAGFTFNNNELGTDSLAFGGLLK